jgi:hypothetical protein
MSVSRRHGAPIVAVLCALLATAACPILPNTNAFDPNAPDELRAPATVSGSVRYEDGEVGGDVLIEAITTIEDASAVATINTELGTGAFTIQVPT